MKWEVHYTRIVEADDFFDAVEEVKKINNEVGEVMTVCPYIEEELELPKE